MTSTVSLWTAGVVRENHVAVGRASGDQTAAWGISVQGPLSRVLRNQLRDSLGRAGAFIALSRADGAVVEGNRVLSRLAGNSGAVGVEVSSGDDVLVVGNDFSNLASGVAFRAGTGKYRDNKMKGVAIPYSGGSDAGNNQ